MSSPPNSDSAESGLPEGEPDVEVPASPARAKARWSFWEWYWQPQKARNLRTDRKRLTERARLLMTRAQVVLDAAEHLVQLRNADGDLAALPAVADLLKQSASFAALSLLEQEANSDAGGPTKLDASDWKAVCEKAGLANAEDLWDTWLSKSSDGAWDTPPSREKLGELLNVTAELVRSAQRVTLELDALWLRRTFRVGVPILAAAIALGGLSYSSHRRAVAFETAYPWTVSSGSGDGCTSPSQECAEVRYFFHTREESNPWIEFDVGKETRIRSVRVANRNDCPECPGRAVPLVVEISSDHENWTEVGRKQKSFEDWDLDIDKSARWIRFRAQKRTFLHFRQVRIRTGE